MGRATGELVRVRGLDKDRREAYFEPALIPVRIYDGEHTSTPRQKLKFTWRGKALMYAKGPPDSKTGWAHLNASLASGAADRTSRRTASRSRAGHRAGQRRKNRRSPQLPYRL